MKPQLLKLVQAESDVQIDQIDIKALLEKVDDFLHKLGNQISALHFEAEELEAPLKAIAEGTDSRLKLETFKALQHIKKTKINLQPFFKNR